MNTITDIELANEYEHIKQAQTDVDKFEILYDKYYRLIFVFILKKMANQQLTAELTSNVFFKAMINLKKFSFKGIPFSAWLYRIAINEMNQFYRKRKICNAISLDQTELINFLHEIDTTDIVKCQKVVIKAIEKLKDSEIQLIELRYFQDLSFKEISAIYDITENNAKVKVYRILDKLKEILTKLLH